MGVKPKNVFVQWVVLSTIVLIKQISCNSVYAIANIALLKLVRTVPLKRCPEVYIHPSDLFTWSEGFKWGKSYSIVRTSKLNYKLKPGGIVNVWMG